MTPNEILIKGIQAGNYKRIDWLRSLFCLVAEGPEDYKKEPYPYRISQQRDGIYYVDPEKDLTLSKVTVKDPTRELLTAKDTITLQPKDLPNVTKVIETYVGNVILNAITLVYAFEDLIPFQEGIVSISKIESLILSKLSDLPEEGKPRKPDVIYMDSYLKYTEAMIYFMEICDIFVPATTEKTMLPPPGVIKLREELLEKNKDRLDDPAVLAQIDKELVAYDTEWLKDDDDAQGILLAKKLRNEVRRKRFLTVGGQSGFGDGVTVENVPKSLSEGIDVDKLPVSNSSSRAGSFNRGHQTMNGGAQFKKLIRAASNSTISVDDCGSKIGKPVFVTPDKQKGLIGSYVITPTGVEEITEESIKQYYGKQVMIRSPQYCKAEKTDYCKVCVGKKLSLHPTAIAVAVSDIGSLFLILFLKKMHVSGLTTTKMNFKEVIK